MQENNENIQTEVSTFNPADYSLYEIEEGSLVDTTWDEVLSPYGITHEEAVQQVRDYYKTSADVKQESEYSAGVDRTVEMMNQSNTNSIAENKKAEGYFVNKVDQQSVINSPFAADIAKAQDSLVSFEPTKAGDWDVDLGRVLTEEDLIINTEGKTPEWQVTKHPVGLDEIPLNIREFAHPNGVSIDGMTANLFNSQDLSEQQIDTKFRIGMQVLDIANNQFKVKQQVLLDSYAALDKDQQNSEIGKNIQEAQNRNLAINTAKIKKIKDLYQLDIDRKHTHAFEKKTAEYYKTLSEGLTAQQELIDDISDSMADMVVGSDEYNKANTELTAALKQKLKFQDEWDKNWTFNIDQMIDELPSESLGEAAAKLAKKLPGYMLDMVAGVEKGLRESVVNNTWSLITDMYYGAQGLDNEDPWRLEKKATREGALYNMTAVLTEYITPFFGTRSLMSKAGEVTKDLAGLAVAGVWLKPEEGNIIHFINQLTDEEIDWLSTLDIVPKDDDDAVRRIQQRLSSGGQEVALGGIFWSVVWLNRLGANEVWSKIKTQKKHKTFMDTTVQRLTGIDVFQKRVTRLKSRAKLYTESGMDASEVFNKTGHILEPDGNWHFRGDYSKGKWKDLEYGSWSLGSILDDATLYGHIPEAKRVNISINKAEVKGTVSSYYEPDSNTIYIFADNLDGRVIKSKIWHEIQHATDTAQGFAAGGAPRDFDAQLRAEYHTYITELNKLEHSPQMLAIKDKMAKNQKLTKKDMAILDEVNGQAAVLRAERDSRLGVKGRPADKRKWYGPEDFSNRSATANRLYRSLAGERRARHIEQTWDLPFDQVRFDATEVYKDAIYQTSGQKQMAEAAHVVNQIKQQLNKVGMKIDDLPKNEKAMFELLESNNPNAYLSVNKVVADTLVDGYTQAIIKLGDKNFGVSHIVDIHMSPSARKISKCKGKACLFEDPRDILSVVDMIRKVKPNKVPAESGGFKLEYTIQHEGKDAYKLVIKENKTPLDAQGKPRRIAKGKNKGKPIKGENTVVTFHPVDGFNEVSVRDLLDNISDNRTVNINRQFSNDDATAIIADVADKPLKVQSRLLSAQIGQTKDPVIKARIIERVKVINTEIKANKKNNAKVSILEDLKTTEWNNYIYSKLENFVDSLPSDTIFKTRDDIILAAQKYGVTKEEIEASRFFAGLEWTNPGDRLAAQLKEQGGFTKGMLRSQANFRKDNITYRAWKGDDVYDSPEDLHVESVDNGDIITVSNVDNLDEIEISRNMDESMYREIDGYGNPVGEPLDEDQALQYWANDNLNYMLHTEGHLTDAYADNLLVKKGDDRFVSWADADGRNHPRSEQAEYQYQIRWDMHGHPVSTDDNYSRISFFATEEDAMLALRHDDYLEIMHNNMGNNSLDWNVQYEVRGSVFDTLEEAEEEARTILHDWYRGANEDTGSLWKEYTVGAQHGRGEASDYRLDTYNIDEFVPRAGDMGERGNRPDKHWSELNREQPSLTLGSTGASTWHNDFLNKDVLVWTRGMKWDGDAWILDELQSDWAQGWAKNNKLVQEALESTGIDKYDSDAIRTFVTKSKKAHNNALSQVNIQSGKVAEFSPGGVENQAIVEDLFLNSSVKRVNRDAGDETFNFDTFVQQMSTRVSKGLVDAFDEFIFDVLIPQGKTVDDFTHLEFRPWLQTKIKEYKKAGDTQTAPDWIIDIMEGGNVSDTFSGVFSTTKFNRRVPTDEEAKELHKVLLDDIMSTDGGRYRDLVKNATHHKLADINWEKAKVERQKTAVNNRLAINLQDVIPKPPMGETSSYVRMALLDQLTRAMDNGMKEFGWWDANVQNARWYRLANTDNKSVTIDGIAYTNKDENSFIVSYTDQDSNMTQTLWTREELVEHLNARQVDELETAMMNDRDGMFKAVETIGEHTDNPAEMFRLAKPLKTGSVFDSQYDQVMVNVMNKILNSKKTGIKMERVDRGFGEYYWNLDITDDVKNLILGQKHQLYK